MNDKNFRNIVIMSSFWNGYHLRDFLFKSFNSSSASGFFSICVGLFSVSILYQGMFVIKRDLLQKFLDTRKLLLTERKRNSPDVDVTADGDVTEINTNETSEVNPRNSLLEGDDTAENRTGRTAVLELVPNFEFLYLFLASFLHGCYVCVGYTLMNAVMTFNIWIFITVCLGIGVGYLFFHTTNRISDNISSDRNGFQRNHSIETDCYQTSSPVGNHFKCSIEDDVSEDSSNSGHWSNLPKDEGNENPIYNPFQKIESTSPIHRAEDHFRSQSPCQIEDNKTDAKSKGSKGESPVRSRSRTPSVKSNESQPLHSSPGSKDDNSPAPTPQVIVVGAQVHNFQQST